MNLDSAQVRLLFCQNHIRSMKINESQLILYEHNPEKYRAEIKAMNKKMLSEWSAEIHQHKPLLTPDMTFDQCMRKLDKEIRESNLMGRVIALYGQVTHIEHQLFLQQSEQLSMELYLMKKPIYGEA